MQLAEMIRRIAAVEAQAIVAPLIANKDVKTDNEGPQETEVNVHPVWLLVPCTILFMVQSTFLLALQFCLDPAANFMHKAEEESIDNLLMVVKCCMVGVLQLMSLKELLVALHGMVISLNPWILRRHINYRSKSSEANDMGRKSVDCCFLLLLLNFMLKWAACMIAKAMQFLVAVLCLRMGFNVILQADTVQDVIFNGLVLGFITDLDEAAFDFVATTWNIDGKAYDDYEVPQDELKREGDQDVSNHKGLQHEPPKNGHQNPLENAASGRCYSPPDKPDQEEACERPFSRSPVFCRAISLLLQGTRDLFVYMLIFNLYLCQTFDFILAVETGVLPAVRDLCYLMRVRESQVEEGIRTSSLATAIMFGMLAVNPWVDTQEQLDRLEEVTFTDDKPDNFKERCLAGRNAGGDGGIYAALYSNLSVLEFVALCRKHKAIVSAIAGLLFTILVTPVIIKWYSWLPIGLHARMNSCINDSKDDGDNNHDKYTEYRIVPTYDERVTKAGSPSQEPSSARTLSPLLENGGDREQS